MRRKKVTKKEIIKELKYRMAKDNEIEIKKETQKGQTNEDNQRRYRRKEGRKEGRKGGRKEGRKKGRKERRTTKKQE